MASASSAMAAAPDPSKDVGFDVFLPLRNADKLTALLAAQHDPASPLYHHWLTPQAFGLRFGPDSATVARVRAALEARGFAVTAQTRSLHASGKPAAVEAAFGVHLSMAPAEPGRMHVVADTLPRLPAEIADTGARVWTFAPFVQHAHSQVVSGPLDTNNRYGQDGAYWFDDLKQAYSYPSVLATVTVGGKSRPLDGTGATIAALMSSDMLDSDIAAMFAHENWQKVTGKKPPTLAGHIYVNGAQKGKLTGAFAEASLDTQMEIGGAPGATVYLYDIPDLSDGNTLGGYVYIDEANAVDLVSSSFGGCELQYFPKYNHGVDYRGILQTYHELFLQGNSQGISFLASSGDSAGKECPTPAYFFGMNGKFVAGIESPAADPNVTAVGGTNLITTVIAGSLQSSYVGENAWADPEIPYDPYGIGVTAKNGFWGAGSGASGLWPQPSYQTMVTTGSAMRTVPDVGMQVGGCPAGIAKLDKKGMCNGGGTAKNGNGNTDRSAVVVAIQGKFYGLIGTSVSSPEFASAMALLIEQHGRMGNLNTYLYKEAAAQAGGGRTRYHVGIPGYNGLIETLLNNTYSLSAGVGTPYVAALVGQAKAPLAENPQTPSNP